MVSENDNLFLWGPFLEEVLEIQNPFENLRISQEDNLDGTFEEVKINSVSLGEDFLVVSD